MFRHVKNINNTIYSSKYDWRREEGRQVKRPKIRWRGCVEIACGEKREGEPWQR